MKLVLAAVFALVATAAVADEGRYVTVAGVEGGGSNGVWVTDTKTGKVKFCWAVVFFGIDPKDNSPSCTAWSDG